MDKKTIANLLNGQRGAKKHRRLVDKGLNHQYNMIMSGWKPYKDSGKFIEWRKREHNKVADCIANLTLKSKHSFAHRNEELLVAIQPGNANFLTFSDGVYWAEDNLAAGAWVSYVLGGHWGTAGCIYSQQKELL